MSRYIDADELKRSIHGTCSLKCISLDNLFAIMDKQPSIDIVRCKECKHWLNHKYADYDQNDFVYYCAVHKVSFSGKDFCSYGKREGE